MCFMKKIISIPVYDYKWKEVCLKDGRWDTEDTIMWFWDSDEVGMIAGKFVDELSIQMTLKTFSYCMKDSENLVEKMKTPLVA